jgi:hypothetical protein
MAPTSPLHSTLTIRGWAPGLASKRLRLEGHLNARPWHTLGVVDVGTNQQYAATIRLDEPGMLNLRIVLPNGDLIAGRTRVRG